MLQVYKTRGLEQEEGCAGRNGLEVVFTLSVEAAIQVSRSKTSLADKGLGSVVWFVYSDLYFTGT